MGFRHSGSEKDESRQWKIFLFFAPWKHMVMWESIDGECLPCWGALPPVLPYSAPLFLVLMMFLLQVKHGTNQIVMNCADIDIITASYAPEGDEGRAAVLWCFCCCCQRLTTSIENTSHNWRSCPPCTACSQFPSLPSFPHSCVLPQVSFGLLSHLCVIGERAPAVTLFVCCTCIKKHPLHLWTWQY